MINYILKKIYIILLILFSLLISILSIEGISRVLFKKHLDHKEFRLNKPLPYKNADYFNDRFVEIMFSDFKFFTPENKNLVLFKEKYTPYINLISSNFKTNQGELIIRKTIDNDNKNAKKIFVFGGSTVFCSETPDQFTLTSFLQRYINQDEFVNYNVYNLGTTSVTINQQLNLLEEVKHNLNEGDIVVFLDGFNDAYQTFYKNNPSGTIIFDNRKAKENLNSILFKIYNLIPVYLKQNSYFVQNFINPYDYKNIPSHLKNKKISEDNKKILESNYKLVLEKAEKIVSNFNAKFYHFFQPTIFHAKSSQYHNKLKESSSLIYPGIEESIFYSDEVYNQIKMKNNYDLRNIFSNEKEIFLDSVHVAHRGNNLIAYNIHKTLFRKKTLKKIDFENLSHKLNLKLNKAITYTKGVSALCLNATEFLFKKPITEIPPFISYKFDREPNMRKKNTYNNFTKNFLNIYCSNFKSVFILENYTKEANNKNLIKGGLINKDFEIYKETLKSWNYKIENNILKIRSFSNSPSTLIHWINQNEFKKCILVNFEGEFRKKIGSISIIFNIYDEFEKKYKSISSELDNVNKKVLFCNQKRSQYNHVNITFKKKEIKSIKKLSIQYL